MATDTTMEDTEISLLESIRGARDAISVRRVFGDPYLVDGVTVIPVARVAGGGGGGSGHEEGAETGATGGGGFGTGFGMGASPVGMYTIRDGEVDWKPSVDVNRLVRGGQVLGGIIAVCTTLVLVLRRR